MSDADKMMARIKEKQKQPFILSDIKTDDITASATVMLNLVKRGLVKRLPDKAKGLHWKMVYQYQECDYVMQEGDDPYNPFLVFKDIYPEFFEMPKLKGVSKVYVQDI